MSNETSLLSSKGEDRTFGEMMAKFMEEISLGIYGGRVSRCAKSLP